jgi:hypothetical protein
MLIKQCSSPHLKPLSEDLQKHFGLHLSRAKGCAYLILGFLLLRTVNLWTVAQSFGGSSKLDSSRKRAKRFVSQVSFCHTRIALYVVKVMGIFDQASWILTMDRTNWQFGKVDINILYLSVVFKRVALPLFFILLKDQKRGNSSALDRVNILRKFLEVFPKEKIRVLLGDREFIGPVWISYLQAEQIPYCFRIKEEGQYIENVRGKFIKAKELLRHLKCGERKSFGVRKIGKQGETQSSLSATRSLRGELLVVMHSEGLETPCGVYELRWSIECLFKGLKSNGFNLEDTHLTKSERIETLLNILIIAFCYAYDWGQMQELPEVKNHGYPQHSVFRTGLDALRRALINVSFFMSELKKYFKSLLRVQIPHFKCFVP